jgi:hypothetical protein
MITIPESKLQELEKHLNLITNLESVIKTTHNQIKEILSTLRNYKVVEEAPSKPMLLDIDMESPVVEYHPKLTESTEASEINNNFFAQEWAQLDDQPKDLEALLEIYSTSPYCSPNNFFPSEALTITHHLTTLSTLKISINMDCKLTINSLSKSQECPGWHVLNFMISPNESRKSTGVFYDYLQITLSDIVIYPIEEITKKTQQGLKVFIFILSQEESTFHQQYNTESFEDLLDTMRTDQVFNYIPLLIDFSTFSMYQMILEENETKTLPQPQLPVQSNFSVKNHDLNSKVNESFYRQPETTKEVSRGTFNNISSNNFSINLNSSSNNFNLINSSSTFKGFGMNQNNMANTTQNATENEVIPLKEAFKGFSASLEKKNSGFQNRENTVSNNSSHQDHWTNNNFNPASSSHHKFSYSTQNYNFFAYGNGNQDPQSSNNNFSNSHNYPSSTSKLSLREKTSYTFRNPW